MVSGLTAPEKAVPPAEDTNYHVPHSSVTGSSRPPAPGSAGGSRLSPPYGGLQGQSSEPPQAWASAGTG